MGDSLDDLFPAPSSSGGPNRPILAPRTLPGITPASTETVRRLIKESSERWHLFMVRDYRPHNHSIHGALALWAMGADVDVINALYQVDIKLQSERFPSPGKITEENWKDHLGDDSWYSAYIEFFRAVVQTKGVAAAVEEYVFSTGSNWVQKETLKEGQEQPQMLNRFMDGIIHPLIHVGHGLEFGVPGLVAEGLAWTAVHLTSSTSVMPASLWSIKSNEKPSLLTSQVESLASRFIGLGTKGSTSQEASNPTSGKQNVHALTILARILKDSRFEDIPLAENYVVVYSNIEQNPILGPAVSEYVKQWSYDVGKDGELERKIEEIVWACVVMYAVGGWAGGKVLGQGAFNTDFFQVHFVTSALFLPSLVSYLSPSSQELLLRSFLSVCITWWLGRNRPPLPIREFYESTSPTTSPIQPRAPVHKDAFPAKGGLVNPWFELMAESMVLPDDHLVKAQRALAHFADVYGGSAGVDETELEGSDKLDGTLFIRAAILTNERLRTVKDCGFDMAGYWERRGFYKNDPGELKGVDLVGVMDELRDKH